MKKKIEDHRLTVFSAPYAVFTIISRLFKLDIFRIQNFDVPDLVPSVCCHLACSGSYSSGVAHQTSEIKETKK